MKIWPPPTVVARTRPRRFPFVIPYIPEMERVSDYLEISRQAGWFSNFGPNNSAFEAEVAARYAPASRVSACTSCTTGMSAALLALRIARPVLVPGFTFPATHDAVRAAGLQAVVADVEPGTGVIGPGAVSAAVRESGIGAVLAVRPYGIWTDLSDLADACRLHGIPLVIDNASGFGVRPEVVARYLRDDAVEVFSLHATKPASIGEGGVMIYPPALHDAMRASLNFGMVPGTAEVLLPGVNGKMDEIRAAVARAMLEQLPARIRRRQAMAAVLARVAEESGLQPFIRPGEEWRAPWHCFPVRLPDGIDPAAVVEGCARAGLQIRRYYHPVLVGGGDGARLPGASALAARTICLPIYDGPEADDAEEIWDVFYDVLDHAT